MARTHLVLLSVAACIAAAPAAAAVTVIGNSSARNCYEAAELDLPPQRFAIEQCDRALNEESLVMEDVVATHVNRGILRARGGDVPAAIEDFDRAMALDPNEAEAYLNKALILTLKASQARQAVPLFTMALEKKTKRPELAYFGRAAAKEELGDVRSAYADYVSAAAACAKMARSKAELARFSVRAR
jgi:tetratricopeptide (TPR) repeat protein